MCTLTSVHAYANTQVKSKVIFVLWWPEAVKKHAGQDDFMLDQA